MDKFTENMTPADLIEIILSNTNRLVDLYETAIRPKREQLKKAQMGLADEGKQARGDIFSGIETVQASRQRDWIKFKTADADKEYEKNKNELYSLNEQRDIIIEVINAAKAALRVMEMEAKSLHYDT